MFALPIPSLPIPYIILFIILLFFIVRLYLNAKYGFWMHQPVFHVYDIGYFFTSPRIISRALPLKNKYTNFTNIQTQLFSQLTSLQLQRFAHFVQTEYLQNGDNTFSPTLTELTPYFYGHIQPSFFSFFKTPVTWIKKDTTRIVDNKWIGIMTSRPVYLFLGTPSYMNAYYVDYLCVVSHSRKKGIAPQLIQTHHYHQRHQNKNIAISIFKRENELTGIVPLCVYTTYGFSLETWNTSVPLLAKYTLLEINAQNMHLFWNFFRETRSEKFDITIHTELANIVELLKTGNIYIFILMEEKTHVLGAYLFRKTCVYIERKKEVLSCFASICNTNTNTNTDTGTELFEKGFYHSLSQIVAKLPFSYLAIEEISDNFLLVKNIKKKYGKPHIVSPTAYFLYNYVYPTALAYKTFVLL